MCHNLAKAGGHYSILDSKVGYLFQLEIEIIKARIYNLWLRKHDFRRRLIEGKIFTLSIPITLGYNSETGTTND